MATDSRSGWPGKGALEDLLRERIRATIEAIIDEELEAALGAGRSARVGALRAGYRHGKRARRLRPPWAQRRSRCHGRESKTHRASAASGTAG